MKAASPALIALLNAAIAEGATSTLYSADLYTFTPISGPVIRLCTATSTPSTIRRIVIHAARSVPGIQKLI